MKRAALLGLVTALVPACPDHSDDYDYVAGERRGVVCANTVVKWKGMGGDTNPTDGADWQTIDEQRQCWMQTIDVDTDDETSAGSLARLDGAEAIGDCAFTGTGPNYQVNLADGFCQAPTADGYYRLRAGAAAMPSDISGLELDGIIEWARGDDLITGPGFVFLSVPQLDPVMHKPAYDPALPADPIAGCKMPACSGAAFAGHGTLIAGDPLVCNELLAGHTDPVQLRFDELDRMSFAADTPEAMRRWGVHGQSACTLDTWTGSRPYPYARYHVDPGAGTVSFDETQLHTSGQLSDVCTIRWMSSLAGC